MTTTTTTAATPPPLVPQRWTPTDAPTGTLVDLFPARVTLPTGATSANPDAPRDISPARLMITADPADPTRPNRIYVFVDSTIGPALLYTAPADSPVPAPRTFSNRSGTLRILIPNPSPAAGSSSEFLDEEPPPALLPADLSFSKEAGCGCGSAVKSFLPFTHPYAAG